MNRIITLTIIALISGAVHSQGYVPSPGEVERFFSTKTLVVLENTPLSDYNTSIREMMEQEWTVTPFDFISEKEFEEKRKDTAYSFIYTSVVTFENDRTDARYRFLHLSLGGDYYRLNEMPDIASVPLSYYKVDYDNYSYKVGILVRFIQSHALLIRDHPEIISSNVLEYYNKNIKDIRTKTLYLIKEELAPDIRSESKVKAVYPYKFEFVTREDIENAIREKDPDVVFLHKVGPEGTKLDARSYKVIIGAADANFYYFDYHKVNDKNPDGLLESDLKKMTR
jgi:hypothetical protein